MIRISRGDFVDEFGRTLMLRGVNLAGSSKVPFTPNGATYRRDGFFDHRNVSFIGRPFPLEQADEHFSRLRSWGLTFLRFLVTWEAIEHAGAGIYDDAYLDYVRQIILKAGEYGIQLFIDPHQDVWSRFTGGDGAPGWTLEAVGMDLTRLQETGAAIVHALHGDPFPQMIWPTNTHKLASATMFALFFAGNDLAPCTKIEGEPAQEFLQRHYIAAFRRLAHWIRDLPNVAGFDTMNEPMRGYMGVDDLNECCGRPRLGEFPAPLQAMLLASGIPQEVDVWEIDLRGNRRTSTRLINPQGMRLWRDGIECIWRDNGVWDFAADGSPRLLRPNHFSQVKGRLFDFNQDYYRPFANRFAREIREEAPGTLIFIETEPSNPPPRWSEDDAADIVYAPHWYDVVPLLLKRFYSFIAADYHTGRLVILPHNIRRSFRSQLQKFRLEASQSLRGAPVLIGEVGVPYDLNHKYAYRTGNFNVQVNALDRTLQALEDNLLSCTIWNYTPDNTNERGDQWNDEDFSIFSRDQQWDPGDINSGGRSLPALIRPYPIATAGKPVQVKFDIHKKRFEYVFDHDPGIDAPTELYVPNFQYPRGFTVTAPAGTAYPDSETQRLKYKPAAPGGRHTILITPRTG
jgi:hypothetical protein